MQPRFDPAWIVRMTDDYVVVDKPAGVATQPEEKGLRCDLTSLLRAYLRERGEPDGIGVHQRLDRETSGLLLFSRTRKASVPIAHAFEARAVEKEYVAGVVGDPGPDRVLRHRLGERMHGLVRVDPKGKDAVTELRVLARRGDRALVALRPHTGRTHQLRVQLADVGAPIAGDPLYGAHPASRMLLHATRLAVPYAGGELRFESRLPPEFERFLEGEEAVDVTDRAAFAACLERALHRRGALFSPPEGTPLTDAFRLFHRHGDGAPEIAIDRYGDYAVLHAYEDEGALELDAVIASLASLGFRGGYLKRRRRETDKPAAAVHEALAPEAPVFGEAAPFELEIHEHGIAYPVRLGDGLSTGIFLDQRENRRRLFQVSPGRSVLNLFAYCGAFTVAAVEGGAEHTLTVDAARPAIERARGSVLGRNPAGEHRFLVEDVFALLPRLARRGERFDHVVVDPPTHARTKKHRFHSGKDWVGLAAACARLVSPGGSLWASTNDHRMDPRGFERFLRRGIEEAGRGVIGRKVFGPPIDFPQVPGLPPHQKTVVLTIA